MDMIVRLRTKLKVGRQRPQHFHFVREAKDDFEVGKIAWGEVSITASRGGAEVNGWGKAN